MRPPHQHGRCMSPSSHIRRTGVFLRALFVCSIFRIGSVFSRAEADCLYVLSNFAASGRYQDFGQPRRMCLSRARQSKSFVPSMLSTHSSPTGSAGKTLFIQGLPSTMQGQDLQGLFDRFGHISWAATMPVPHNSSASYGYVQFEETANALEAQQRMHGKVLPAPHQAVTLFVDFAEDGVVPPSLRLWSRLQHVKRELTLHRRTDPAPHQPAEGGGGKTISSSLLQFLESLKPDHKTDVDSKWTTQYAGDERKENNVWLRERHRHRDRKEH